MFKYIYIWLKQIDPVTAAGSETINIETLLFFDYLSGVLFSGIIAISSLLSLIYIFTSLYIINNYNVEQKLANYPRIVKFINLTKKYNTFLIIFNLFILIVSLLVIAITSYLVLSAIFKL
jgi:hypothetical protein